MKILMQTFAQYCRVIKIYVLFGDTITKIFFLFRKKLRELLNCNIYYMKQKSMFLTWSETM